MASPHERGAAVNQSVWVYRRLISLYPRPFRREYSEDLAVSFALLLDEHGPARCWLRTIRDLCSTVPTQHMEVHMKHNPNHPADEAMRGRASITVFTVCLAFAIGGVLLALMIGASLYALLMLGFSAVAIGLAVMARKAAKPALALESRRSWKKFLMAGAVLLTAIVIAINLPANRNDELSELGWSLMMLAFLLSFSLIGAGIVLAATQFSQHRHGHQTHSHKHVG